MEFSASAATKDAARLRRRRFCTPPRFFSTLPHRFRSDVFADNWRFATDRAAARMGLW